jgi:hypothetical protein
VSGRTAALQDTRHRAACARPRPVQSPSQGAAFSSPGDKASSGRWGTSPPAPSPRRGGGGRQAGGEGLRRKRWEPAPYRDTSERLRQNLWPNQAM